MLMLGTESPLIPLTREVFGENGDRVLRGAVMGFSTGTNPEVGKGVCLSCEMTKGGTYIHPTLCSNIRATENLTFWTQISLRDGKLILQKREKDDDAPLGRILAEAAPVQMATTMVDNVIYMMAAMAEQQNRCVDSKCQRVLDVRNAVLFRKGPESDIVMCGPCFDKARDEQPHFRDQVYIDGRRLPYHSPVPSYK